LQRRVRERNTEIVTLMIRIKQLEQSPLALALEWDPALDAKVSKTLKNGMIKHLIRENAKLLAALGSVETRLQRGCR
jgi:hypothetical protein